MEKSTATVSMPLSDVRDITGYLGSSVRLVQQIREIVADMAAEPSSIYNKKAWEILNRLAGIEGNDRSALLALGVSKQAQPGDASK